MGLSQTFPAEQRFASGCKRVAGPLTLQRSYSCFNGSIAVLADALVQQRNATLQLMLMLRVLRCPHTMHSSFP